jgi:DNA primase
VGKEGKEAFEGRLGGALPLSEYLVMHLSAAIDISHADGKARFVAEARPLLERMPEGPYRELLLDRLATAIGVSAERFLKIVGPMTTPEASPPANLAAPRPPRTARSAGRGSLVRQAAQVLLHFPSVAARLDAADIQALRLLDEPGVEVLLQLLDGLRLHPAATTAQLLERFRDHPAADRLGRLAAEPSIVPDEAAAGNELKNALQKLGQGAAAAELDALIAKEQGSGLSAAERDRLRELLQRGRG